MHYLKKYLQFKMYQLINQKYLHLVFEVRETNLCQSDDLIMKNNK